MVPEALFPPMFPSTCHVTPALLGSLKTVAVNCCVWEVVIEPRLGETVTESVPGVIVTVAVAAWVLSATEVAVTVTVDGFGTAAGALYVAAVVVTLVNEPQAVPLQPAPESDHVTPLLCASWATVAVKF